MMKTLYMIGGTMGVEKQLYANNSNEIYRIAFWHLCDDTEHTLLETICPFDEKEALVSRIAGFSLSGLTIRQIFDTQSYDPEKLCIL